MGYFLLNLLMAFILYTLGWLAARFAYDKEIEIGNETINNRQKGS